MNYKGFSKEKLLKIYKLMFTSRILDDKQLILLKQGKGFFHIGGSGHESAGLGAAISFNHDIDYAYPYYRDQAFCLGWGMSSKDQLLAFLAKNDDPSSGGRQMPQHFGHKELNIVSQSSPTGTQFLQAVGAAFVLKKENKNGVVYVSSGEGTTSQGDFHEALNWASREKAPVIFHIEDNGYAISVPISEQVSGSSVYNISSGYESLARYEVDGTDFFETHLAFKQAIDRSRKGKGPSIIVSKVVRLLPHSSSDDHRKYRDQEELNKDQKRDPINIFKTQCIKEKIATDVEFKQINDIVKKNVDTEAEWAQNQIDPPKTSVSDHLFSELLPTIDNTDSRDGEKIVMVDAINHALFEEMNNNKKMLIYGQDVAGGKGGVFTATRGLTSKFGSDRVFNSPLAESSIIGTAIGMATLGYKPVVEIQFGDYIWTAMMQIRNELATLRYRSNGKWFCPLVVRVPVGGYIHGSLCHSQSIDGYFTHLPGIYIAYPSNARDAKALLKMACRMNDPVIFMEHKGLYRQGFSTALEPDENFLMPFGKANVIQAGTDVTIVTWGAIVQKSIEASKNTKISTEIIDLRTLCPFDMETILSSIKKTNRLIIAHEDNLTNGFGAEISAQISEKGFEYLDAPIKRVASKDIPVAYSSVLEDELLLQTSWIEKALIELVSY